MKVRTKKEPVKRTRGRPLKGRVALSKAVYILCTEEQREALKKFAASEGESLSSWGLEVMLKASGNRKLL